MDRFAQVQAEGRTGTGLSAQRGHRDGGQVRPLKFRKTCCEYWICGTWTVM